LWKKTFFKQIIPYVVVRHGDRYLLVRARIGKPKAVCTAIFSGVAVTSTTPRIRADQNVIEAGLERELEEEIHLLGRRQS